MVVGEQDAGAAEAGGVGDDLAHRQIDRALMPLAIAAKVDAARTVVDMRDPQRLVVSALGPTKQAAKKARAASWPASRAGVSTNWAFIPLSLGQHARTSTATASIMEGSSRRADTRRQHPPKRI